MDWLYKVIAFINENPWVSAMVLGFIISEVQALLPNTESNGVVHYLVLRFLDLLIYLRDHKKVV
jgi:hypothetical protein